MKIRTGILSGRGLGDAVADLAHLTGLDRLAKLYEQRTGRSCGCEERRQILNNLVPFNNNTSS